VGVCLIRMVRSCRSTCDVQMCLGSGSPFCTLDKIYAVGKRTQETTGYFIQELAVRISTRIQRFNFYNRHVEDAFGAEVSFAQLVKLDGRGGASSTTPKNHAQGNSPVCSGSTDRSAEELLPARSIGQERIRPNANSARRAGMDGAEDPV
jgi:hypothetical protein